MISIDQNCHPLWDVVPKLQALAAKGHSVTQYIEDFDTAFTSMGSSVHAGALHIERERYHRSGGADWGAALFYSEFLGRQPVDIRRWEPYTGMKTDVLARHLGQSVDDMFDTYSPGDNWQLIGPSYAGDERHHRTIGDISWSEAADYVHQIVGIAREDFVRSFPASKTLADSLSVLNELAENALYFNDELAEGQDDKLVAFYNRMLSLLPEVGQHATVDYGMYMDSLGAAHPLLQLFLTRYEQAAALYNQAIHETDLGLRPLETAQGELPFFGVMSHDGHEVRSTLYLQGDHVRLVDREWPIRNGRLSCDEDAPAELVAGKAILLVLQVRMGPDGDKLALPYHGSMYMPASYRFQRLLTEAGLLEGPVNPIVRVRLRLLDRLRELDTVIHLPAHLAAAMGKEELPACELGEHWQDLQVDARRRLESFKDPASRQRWLLDALPDATATINALDARRRELAAVNEKNPELRDIWKHIKPLQQRQLQTLVQQIDRDWQVRDIDYWDSRGAIWPWCLALGGENFYKSVIDRAEVYEENA